MLTQHEFESLMRHHIDPEVFLARWPTLGKALEKCKRAGMSAWDAGHSREVQDEAHACGCIGIIGLITLLATINILWEFWDHIKPLV